MTTGAVLLWFIERIDAPSNPGQVVAWANQVHRPIGVSGGQDAWVARFRQYGGLCGLRYFALFNIRLNGLGELDPVG